MAAAALPVPLATAATAAEQRNPPPDRPAHLVRRHALPDSSAEGPSLAGSRAGEGRGHPGRPESLGYWPGFPRPDAGMEVPDFPGLRDFLAEIPDELPRYPDDPPEYLPWHDRHHGLDPDSDDDSTDVPDPEDSAPGTPESPPDEDGTDRTAPPEAAPSPSRPAPHRPSPSPRSDVAGRLDQRPYKPLQPPARPKKQDRTPPDDADADAAPAASASPYAMDSPTAPVERVLPMGAGLALTGLGLAFLGLRLRRH
ncbi:hypothetical protein [Streptomyces sp. NPDC053427]|uniref:hypothetical protein n=1 Tax=Streptomyces sp. NPDC053427 TaxID=3365701 RepID=UPI0037CCE4F1